MPTVLTPEEIRAKLRGTHPADRDKVANDLYKAPVQQATRMAQQVVASATNQVNVLKAEVDRLTAQLRTVATGLEVRKRMSPQDLRDALNGLFETYNFSPAEEMVLMLKDPQHPYYIAEPGLRLTVLKELQSYVMPKLKSTEVRGSVDHKHTIVIKRFGDDGKVTVEEGKTHEAIEDRKAAPVTDVEEVTSA